MFKLLRLEDRIVLDGAAMDAIHQKDQQDRHQHDLLMQAQGDHVSDHHLTPDAHQADVGAHDSGHDGTHTDLDTHQPLFLAEVTDSQDSGLHVLVISSNIKDADTLAAAAKDDVMVIRYDAANTNIDDLATLIHNALGGKKADSIAFATHNGNANAQITLTGTDITSPDTLSNPHQQAFWKSIGSDLSDHGRIDLLACNVTMDHAGEQFVADLQHIAGKTVAASSDITGNAAHGGDWTLETGNVDVTKVYFDDHRIDSYDGVLAGVNHFYNGSDTAGGLNILDNQSAEKGVYTRFSFSSDTFHSLNGPVSYTVAGKPTWLSWSATDRTFWGTPKNVGSQVLQSSYTMTVTATDAAGATDTLSFTLKVANAGTETGQHTPVFVSGDPTNEFFITEGTPTGTHLTPDIPIAATDADTTVPSALAGYRFVAPTGATIPFAIGSDGTISSASSSLTPGKYYYTVEAYDGTGYQDTSHVIVNVVPAPKPGAWLNFSTPSSFAENGGTVTLTANLSMTSAAVTTLNLNFAGGATFGTDYLAASNIITVPAGSLSSSMTLTGKQDLLAEGNESIVVSITGPAGVNLASQYTPVTATIVDNTPPQVSLSLSANTFSEKGGTTVLTAAIAGGATTSTDLHVNLSFGGQATLNTDYSVTNTMITIPAGQPSAAITVTGLKDTPFDAGNETVIFTGTSTDAPINPASSALTATIMDFDFASQPTVTLQYNRPYLYENETAILTAKLLNTAGITSPINVYYYFVSTGPLSATLGVDYNVTPSPSMITIDPMAGGKDVTIIGKIDGITETTDLHITAVIDAVKTIDANVGSPSTADILIKDYTVPIVHLSLASGATVLEGNVATVPINVTLDRPNPNNQVNVFLNASGAATPGYITTNPDYKLWYDSGRTTAVDAISGQYMVTFTPGVTARTLYVEALTDVFIEGTEPAIFNIATAGQFAIASADTVTMPIIDANTSAAMVSLTLPTATFAESGANSTVLNLTLSEAIQGVVTANLSYSGTAVLGTDFTVSGTSVSVSGTNLMVTIPAANNWAGVTLIGKADSVFDPNETASFTLSSVTNAGIASPSAMTATIIDSNVMSIGMAFGSTFHEQLSPNSTTLTITPSGDPIQSGSTVNMYLMPHNSGTYGYATPNADYTLSSPAVWNTAGYYTIPITDLSTKTITVTGVSDTIVEPTEIVGFGAGFAPTMTGTLGYAATNLINDTTSGAGLNVWLGTIGSFNEAGGTATMKVFMDHAVASDTTISLAYGGTATGSSGSATPQLPTTYDYTVAGTSGNPYGTIVTIPAGQTSATLTFTGISDGAGTPYYEGNETISVSVQPSPTAQYTVGALPLTSIVTGTIIEAQAIPTVSMTYAAGYSATFPENPNAGNGLLALNVPYPSQLNSTVYLSYATAGSNPAVLNTDYIAQTMGIIMAGATSGLVPLYGKDDPLLEPNMTFKVAVSSVVSGGGATAGASPSNLLATVMDDDSTRGAQVYILPPGFAGLNSAGQFSEGQTSTFIVGLDRTVSNVATVNLTFSGLAHYGTVGGQDYTVKVNGTAVDATTGKVQMTFQPGESRANVTVSAISDIYFETMGETVTVQVADAVAGASSITAARFMTDIPVYTATIMDTSTTGPKVTIVPIVSTFPESGSTTGQLAVRLDKIMTENVTVNLAIAQPYVVPTDGNTYVDAQYSYDYAADVFHVPSPNMLRVVIPANQSQQVVNLLGTPDSTYEGNELVRLSIDGSGDVASGKVSFVSGTSDTITLTEIESLPTPKAWLKTTGATVTFGESGPAAGFTQTITVNLNEPSTSDTTVQIDMWGNLVGTNSGLAKAYGGADFSASASSSTTPLTFSSNNLLNVVVTAGSTQTTLALTALTDGLTEGDEYIAPIINPNAASGSPYSVDNTSSTIPTIKLIDSNFNAPSVYISGIDGGTEVFENQYFGTPVVKVDINNNVPWSSGTGFVGIVTLTLGNLANYSAGTSGLVSGQDYSVQLAYKGDTAPQPVVPVTDGKIKLTFSSSTVTEAYIKFYGIPDNLFEYNGSETINIGIKDTELTNLVTTGFATQQLQTLVMVDSLPSAPTVSLVLSPSNATLYEAAGDTVGVGGIANKSGTVSVSLSTPTSESLTIVLKLGSGSQGAFYDSTGTLSDVGFGTSDYMTTSAGGTISFTTGVASTVTDGGPWTQTFTIPAGVQTYNLFSLTAKDDTVYEGPETISVTVNTIGGTFSATGGGVASTSINGVTATIAESDTLNKPYIKMAFDTTPVVPGYGSYNFSEGGAAAGSGTMKLSLFLTKADYSTANPSASNTTVLLTFDNNGNATAYDNPPDGATPQYTAGHWTSPALNTMPGYAYDYSEAITGGGQLTMTGYSHGFTYTSATSYTSADYATYTMLVVIPPGYSQYDVQFTGYKDGKLEGDESVIVQLASTLAVSGAYATSTFVSTATLLDSDLSLAPQVSLSFVQSTFAEGGNAQLVAYFSAGSQNAVQDSTVVVSFTSGALTPVAAFGTDASTYTSGKDFYAFGEAGQTTATIVIPRGATTGSVLLKGMNDGIYEGNEYVTASIANVTGAINTASTSFAGVSATLIDMDSAPTVTLATTYYTTGITAITEADTAHSATVTLYLSKSAANNVTSYLSFTNSGTAPQNGFATSADFAMIGGTVDWTATPIVFTMGQTSATLYFTADADGAYEGNENLVISAIATSGSQYVSPGATATTTVTIVDKDHLDVQLASSGTAATFGENDGVAYPFTVGLFSAGGLGAATSPVVETVTLSFGGVASYTSPQDYQVSIDGGSTFVNVGATGTLSLTIPAGQSTYTAYLKGVNDNVFEGNESVTMGVVTASFNPTSANVITATIVDDDPATYVKLALGNNIAATSAAISESGGNTLVRAMLVGTDGVTGVTAASNITVNLGFTAGNASSGQASMGTDYTYGSSYIVIPAGYTEAVSPGNINAINDNVYEGSETFAVGVKNTAGNLVGAIVSTFAGDQVKTVIIADDDPGPTVSIAISSANASFAENPASAVGAPASATLTVYLSGNANYGANTSPSDEYVFLDISGIASYGASTLYSQGADFFLYDSVGNTTIGASANANGSKIGYGVTIPKGMSSASYYLMGVDDSQGAAPRPWHQYEGPETLSISLGSQSTGTYYSNLQTNTSANKVVATVIDTDDLSLARTVSFSSTVGSIPESTGTYSLNLQVATGISPVTVNFQVIPSHTAAAPYSMGTVASDGAANANGEDFDVQVLYNTNGTYYTGTNGSLSFTGGATFSAGQTAANFSLVIPAQTDTTVTNVQLKLGIFDDKLFEPNETFAINIVSVVGGVTGAFGTAYSPALTGTIVDNDKPVIKIEVDQSQPGMNDSRAPDWTPGHVVYAQYDDGSKAFSYVVPKDGKWNGNYYMAVQADGITPVTNGTALTTGSVEPTWPTALGATVGDNGIIWKNMGAFDLQYTAGMTTQTGTMLVNPDSVLDGQYYVATDTTGTVFSPGMRYNNYFVEGDAQTTGARYFKITKNVDTTDGVLVDWYVNTAPTAGHAALASDYSSGSVISGTAILPAQAGSIVVPYDMTVTADQVAESNTNGYKDTDIVIGIKNVKYFTPPNSAFTQAGLAAVNNNPWALGAGLGEHDGADNLPAFNAVNNGVGAYAEKYVSIYDDDFYPGDTGTGANTYWPVENQPAPLEPAKMFNGDPGYTLGSVDGTLLTQGGYVTIGTNLLYFRDVDQISLGGNVQSFDRLEYTVVTAPSKGTLFVDYNGDHIPNGSDTILANGKTFYEGSVNGVGTYGQLTYLHGNGEQGQLKDSFTFTVSDGVNVSYKGAINDGYSIGTSATSGPWVFGITANDMNTPPVYDNQIFWVDENATGSVYITSSTGSFGTVGYVAYDNDSQTGPPSYNEFYPTTGYATEGGYSGSYIVKDTANEDTAGQPLFTLVQTPVSTEGYISGSKLAIQVASTAGLDFEARQAYTLHVKIYDSSTAGGTATGGYHDAWVAIKVNDKADQGYSPVVSPLPDTTVLSSKNYVYQIPDNVFSKNMSTGATVVYSYYGSAVGNPELSPSTWLHFESESHTFWSYVGMDPRPLTATDFVITVRATYYYQNGEVKNPGIPVESSFTLHYSMASMDLDAVMDALQYLDTDGDHFLPVEGDQVPVQDMMMARSGAPAADATQEVSEVLALLDAEAYAFDEAQA
jgi:hypothetical protein